jgi:hypothetical protein
MRSEAFDAQGQSGVADDRRVDRAGEAFRFEAENARAGIEVVADYRRDRSNRPTYRWTRGIH